MKKLRILSLILVGCLLIAGCGISKTLKLKAIDVSASTFYHNTMRDVYFVLDEGEKEVHESLLESYSQFVTSVKYLENYYYSIISAADFCDSIVTEGAKIDKAQKIYEYKLNNINEKLIVFVENKDATKNNKYTIKLYYVYDSVLSYEDLLKQEALLTRTFLFSSQKDGGFSFKEEGTASGLNGVYDFNKDKGTLSLSFNYKEESLIATTTYNVSVDLYNYDGKALGGRMYLASTQNGKTSKIINEFLMRDFYKKVKIGFVKDSKLYVNMEEAEEKDIAFHNDGDKYIFEVIYDNVKDLKDATTTAIPYGKNN